MSVVDDKVQRTLLSMVRETHQGPHTEVDCVLCGSTLDQRDGYECADGVVCVLCAVHPRFDTDTCPDCGSAWSDTIKPCGGCGLTVQEYERRYREQNEGDPDPRRSAEAGQ